MAGQGLALVSPLAVLGLMIGSFLNVVVHRVPAGLSIVSPGSACGACGHAVRARDNVPIVSWLVLRGRCRDCAAPISWHYPAVEALTGVLFAVAAWRFGWSPVTIAVLVVLAAGVALSWIDVVHQRLPFAITGVAGAGCVLALGLDTALNGAGPLLTAMLSTLLWLGVYGGTWLVTGGRGMGLGDVALAPVLGLLLGWIGWAPSLVGLGAGFVGGAVVGAALLASGRVDRRTRVPHGPFLLGGAAVGLFVGRPLGDLYLRLVGLQ